MIRILERAISFRRHPFPEQGNMTIDTGIVSIISAYVIYMSQEGSQERESSTIKTRVTHTVNTISLTLILVKVLTVICLLSADQHNFSKIIIL